MSNDSNRAVAKYDLNYMIIGIHWSKIQDYVHLNKNFRPNLYKEYLFKSTDAENVQGS